MTKEKTKKFFDKEELELLEMHTTKDVGMYEFDQLVQCINSENVKLTRNEILKAYDAYLRTMGIVGAGTNKEGVTSIFSILGAIECVNPLSDMVDIEKYKVYVDIYTTLNSFLDENHKFANLDEVLDNLRILYKDFTDFTNELMNNIFDDYNNNIKTYGIKNINENTYVDYIISDGENIDKAMVFRGLTSSMTNCFAIIFHSNILSDVNPNNIGVVVDTFPKSVKDNLIQQSKMAEESIDYTDNCAKECDCECGNCHNEECDCK